MLFRVFFVLAVCAFCAIPAPAAASSALDAYQWNLTGSQIAGNCKREIATADKAIGRVLARKGPRTFANTLLPIEDAGADLNDKTLVESFLFTISSDKETRAASLQCNTDESNFQTALQARPDLYAALVAVQKSNTASNVYQRKLLDLWITAVRRSGAGLPSAQRAEFVKLEDKLTDDQNKFSDTLGSDQTTISIGGAQVAGLPAHFVATLTKNADGSYTVPVNESTIQQFMSNAQDEAARKTFYVAYNLRGGQGNVALLQDAIAVRDRLAHLMGYENWASFVLADRMAESPARVYKFLDDLDAKILPKANDDIQTLLALKRTETKNPNATWNPWDYAYYNNILNKTQYAVDEEAIRQYFPVQHVVDAVLNIYHTLLGITFTKVDNPNVWSPDVIVYNVSDTKTGKFIGTTAFDLYPRPGKFSHFANFPILPVRLMPDGAFRPPLSVIVGNWPKPAAGQPALLSHDDVVTFFHEFGHNLAALLTVAPYETLSSGFRWDFVEAPSQMLENFMWQPSVLKQVSSNVTTGDPLPDDLISKMVAARYVDYAYDTTRQIMLATIDLDYHTSGPTVDTTAVWAKVAHDETPVPMYPGILPQAGFGHLMGGYDAGYYGYLWSKVYAQDMFTAFAQAGLENPVVGMRYRKDILQPARTLEPDVEIRNFLGRPMSPEAFYREFGIDVTSAQR
ncbi:MAG: Zn-dependent oligopeptidase [Candidatus Eremiobacteraeota bacterium]|nr:Zn-dependent oligopeptidase [Candidatus Eremiobacteraeota bacterium]